MNPAFGTSPYDLEDIADQATRYNDVIHKAIEHSNNEQLGALVGNKLTSAELNLLRVKIS